MEMTEISILKQKVRIKSINFIQFLQPGESISLSGNIGFSFKKQDSNTITFSCNYDVYSTKEPVDLSVIFLVELTIDSEFEANEENFQSIAMNKKVMDEIDQKIVMLNALIGLGLPLISKSMPKN